MTRLPDRLPDPGVAVVARFKSSLAGLGFPVRRDYGHQPGVECTAQQREFVCLDENPFRCFFQHPSFLPRLRGSVT